MWRLSFLNQILQFNSEDCIKYFRMVLLQFNVLVFAGIYAPAFVHLLFFFFSSSGNVKG